MNDRLAAIDRFAPIDLVELDERAQLLTRRDRKYLVGRSDMERLLEELSNDVAAPDVAILDIDGRRWSHYANVYYDTPQLDSYHLAARRRPQRFKVRTRTYLNLDLHFVEIKTKDAHGNTVKERVAIDRPPATTDVQAVAVTADDVAAYAESLGETLSNTYRRATLVLPGTSGRATIDDDFRAFSASGETQLCDVLIVETKSSGPPTLVDRALWRMGHRPLKFSKYTTALAAIERHLPSNRWRRNLVTFFGAPRPSDLAIESHMAGAADGAVLMGAGS